MIKKLIITILFLIPIYISSFNNTAFFYNSDQPNIIIHLKDLELYLDLNDYITGVVSSEMPALFETEALKAQSVASRSYALSNLTNNTIELTSSINDQVYSPNYILKEKWKENYNTYYQKIAEIVNSTTTEVIKRENKILRTYYFSISNGYTENSETVFNDTTFQSVISEEDSSTTNYKYTKIFTEEELKTKLNLSEITIKNITKNETNHISTITISDRIFTGIELRKLLDLRSTDFEITRNNNTYEITTTGYGHGVGMSQYGANNMAKKGKNYKEILEHYYQNTQISKI